MTATKPDALTYPATPTAGQVITSLEIAEVTGRRHANVLRDIKTMEKAWRKVSGYKLKFELKLRISDLGDGRQRKDPYYVLTKEESLFVLTKFDDEARAKLILRWCELEMQQRRQEAEKDAKHEAHIATARQYYAALQQRCEAIQQERDTATTALAKARKTSSKREKRLADYEKENTRLKAQLSKRQDVAPLKEYVYIDESGPTYTSTAVAREAGMTAAELHGYLQRLGILFKHAGVWYFNYLNAGKGFTVHREIQLPDGNYVCSMLWTSQGRDAILELLHEHPMPVAERARIAASAN